jgi:acyl-CoA synthetase (NDP forming)/GNAT superfamily N-acetyltransferase
MSPVTAQAPAAPATTGFAPKAVLLVDGTRATIRPVELEDRDQLLALHRDVSDRSFYLRFFSTNRSAAETFAEQAATRSPSVWSLLAERHGNVVGMASAFRETADCAEVALLVADDVHGLGLGTLLLERLAEWSRRRGVRRFTADVLAENVSMLRVFHDAGFGTQERRDHGVVEVEMDIEPTTISESAADGRWRRAERSSLTPLLEPRSVAVLGVSRRRGGIGREVLENILGSGYSGDIYALGRQGLDVPGARCLDSIPGLPTGLDLAVVALAAAEVERTLVTLGERGTRACVVLTSGLAERSAAGRAVEGRLYDIATRSGMRIVGPNCFGVISHLRGTDLDATFGRTRTRQGRLAVGSQSGGVGIALQAAVNRRGDGFACFVSLGNKVDVSGNDLLATWADDPDVAVAGLYLESFHDPTRFVHVATEFSRRKPLLVVFGGTSTAGLRAGASHTAASATPARALDAMFRAAGVVAVDSVDELADTAALLVEQPLPRGRRVAVLSNAGGLGILAADQAARAGLDLPDLSSWTQLAAAVPTAASIANPVDLGAGASAEDFGAALHVMFDGDGVDAVLVVLADTAVTELTAVCASIEDAAGSRGTVPVLSAVVAGEPPPARTTTRFASPEDALRALGRVTEYSAWRGEDDAPPILLPQPTDEPRAAGWLSAEDTASLVTAYGARLPRQHLVTSPDAAVAAGDLLGYPVVVKAAVPVLVHKTESGSVRTGLRSAAEVRLAAVHVLDQLPAAAQLLVQEQATGPEVAVGILRDQRFGPLVMLASGGVDLDLWGDQVFLMPPARRSHIRMALRSLRTWPRLTGHRGAAGVDVEQLVDLVESVCRLAVERPDVLELDLNPVLCTERGPVCVDVKARLG